MSEHPAPIYELGPDFYDEVTPATFPEARLRYRNQEAAHSIGLEALSEAEWQDHFWQFKSLPHNISRPLALRYHGHQFQTYNPALGDGRGFLFAQFLTPRGLLDLGTKGSGQTPYSRQGDGRLTLKGAFREILATELLQSYGVNTSKTLSVFETGEQLERHDEPSPTRAAVLVRLNHSHIRFGTFQRLAYLGQIENLQKLLIYCVRHYYPHLQAHSGDELATLFLKEVSARSAQTVAEWMTAGFVHGVLNTDNMNITGESFDYGPYRFLPHYDPAFTAAYFDHSGLYCFGRQPSAVLWNLYQLGAALKAAYPNLPVEEALEDYGDHFNLTVQTRLLKRLNLKPLQEDPQVAADLTSQLISSLFQYLDKEKAPFEQTLYDLHSGGQDERLQRSPLRSLYGKESFSELRDMLGMFATADEELARHPYFQTGKACSLVIDELESIWAPIASNDDWSLFEKKLAEIRSFRGVYG